MGPTLRANCTYPSVDFMVSPNPVISTRAPRILLPNMPTASKVIKAIRLCETPVSTNSLLIWTPFMVAVRLRDLQ